MAEELGTLSFASWVRRGLAAAVALPDAESAGAPETPVRVDVEFDAADTATSVNLSLVGPGDIAGFDARAVVRERPKPNDNDAEYGHLALLELGEADLPWRYTPAAPAGERLRPWLALVVLTEAEGEVAPAAAGGSLPTLTVADARNLPDARESWAWAHVQVEGAGLDADAVTARVEGRPGLVVARLLSPRILEKSQAYIAALVPTFERGRLAGLGTPPGLDSGATDAFQPAWDSSATGPVTLPVYHSWRFQTGTVASFEQLARSITPQKVPPGVGRRELDVSLPGLELPAANGGPLGVEGALQSVEAAAAGPTPWPDPERRAFVSDLSDFVNEPVRDGTRVVAPPLYGRWYAAADELSVSGGAPPWFHELNADPRTRVAAALGTEVVQREQQALLRGGWEQVGEITSINQERRVLQLGREASLRVFQRHVLTGSRQTFYTWTAKLHARVLCGDKTVCERIDGSRVGGDLFDPSWRRWTAIGGWLGRRQGRRKATPPVDILDRLNDGERPAPEPGLPPGITTTTTIFETLCPGGLPHALVEELLGLGPQTLEFWGLLLAWVVRDLIVRTRGDCWWIAVKTLRFSLTLLRMAVSEGDTRRRLRWCEAERIVVTDVLEGPRAPGFTPFESVPASIPAPPRTGAADSADAGAFRQAITDFIASLEPPPRAAFPPPMDLAQCQTSLTLELDPARTVAASMRRRLVLDASLPWNAKDDLEPLFAPPEYEQPMYRPLAALSKDWILPGLDAMLRDSAGLVLTNQRFVEAYMAGLNDEMTRELIWNELPTDQRGTYFRQFWDQAGRVDDALSPVPPEALRDIRPIASWSGNLGSNSPRRRRLDGSGEHLVLILRAQLIKRYPNVIVYAAEARAGSTPALTGRELHPVFYGLLEPDVAFYGFELTPEEVRADPGWFFILQEQPGEPRFADETGAARFAPLATHAAAADVAAATFQVPFRLGIHGSALLPAALLPAP